MATVTRPLASGSGLRATETFPEQARELGRRMGIYGEATIQDNVSTDDGGGIAKDNWVTRPDPVAARIDPLLRRSQGAQGTTGGEISETGIHLITFYPAVDVDTENRVVMEGQVWAVQNIRERTDALVRSVTAIQISP